MVKVSIVDVVVDSKLPYFIKSFESLLEQDCLDFELVLVVGYPGDKVREFMAEQKPQFDVVLIQEPPRERYPCRASANNMGLDAATGDIYLGTQDDVIYPENWVSSHIAWHTMGNGPWFIFNRVKGALTSGGEKEEDKFWERISNPRKLPIVSRWQYASGHSFSLPMKQAKLLRHNEEFNFFWGFEDLAWSRDALMCGCKFIIDNDVVVTHQPHGARADEKMARSKEEFDKWLMERSRNRRKFAEIYGFCPEYGVLFSDFE